MVFIVFVLFALVGSFLTVLAIQNLATSVHITLFVWQSPGLPVGVLLVGAFLLGAVLLYLVSALSAMRERRELKGLRKRVAEMEKEKEKATVVQAPSMPSMPMPMPMGMPRARTAPPGATAGTSG